MDRIVKGIYNDLYQLRKKDEADKNGKPTAQRKVGVTRANGKESRAHRLDKSLREDLAVMQRTEIALDGDRLEAIKGAMTLHDKGFMPTETLLQTIRKIVGE